MGRRIKKIIHVNQHAVKSNRKHGLCDPVLTVKTYKTNDYAHEVVIDGPCRIVYRPDRPLSCGAHVWIESYADVKIVNKDGELENKDVTDLPSGRRTNHCRNSAGRESRCEVD